MILGAASIQPKRIPGLQILEKLPLEMMFSDFLKSCKNLLGGSAEESLFS